VSSLTTHSENNQASNAPANRSITINCDARWEVYHRLQELDFDCTCGGFQPLRVQVKTPVEVVQLWSILKRVSQPRLSLAADLQQCLQASKSDFC